MSKRDRKSRRRAKRDSTRGSISGSGNVPAMILVVVLALVAMGRLCAYDFTNWDDDQTVAANPAFNPPTLSGIVSHWRSPHMDLYVPVTYTAWGVVAGLAYDGTTRQLNPRVFHTFNVLLHALNSALV